MPDLKDQIHALFETGLLPVAADDIARRDRPVTTPFPVTARPAITIRRVTAVTAGLAAAACAAALVVTQLGGVPAARPARPALLDAAYVRHLAAASRLALAQSGQAMLVSRQTIGDVLQQVSTDHLTFAGANWDDSATYTPALSGQPQRPESAINRVVDGQAYDYFVGADGLGWYHDTGPDAVASLHIPDPRALLGELAPAARFVRAGRGSIGGVAVTILRATSFSGLPVIALPGIEGGGQVTALQVWVDGHGVVRQLALSIAQQVKVWKLGAVLKKSHGLVTGPAQKQSALGQAQGGPLATTELQRTSVTVTFSAIGQPQSIAVPPNAIPVYGLG